MTLFQLEAAARGAGMQPRLHPEGGLEIVCEGANLWADPSGEVRVLVQDERGAGERALRRLLGTSRVRARPSPLEGIRRLAVKALLEARAARSGRKGKEC